MAGPSVTHGQQGKQGVTFKAPSDKIFLFSKNVITKTATMSNPEYALKSPEDGPGGKEVPPPL